MNTLGDDMFQLRHLPVICLTTLLMLATTNWSALQAQTIDPHRVYEQRCARCHTDHAGAFARESLRQDEDRIVGRKSGRALQAFLTAGHGRAEAAEVEVLVDHLTAILHRDALFQRKCRFCHSQSLGLARGKLILREGRLTGRYTGCDITDFLGYHGRLTADEAAQMVDTLTQHLQTAGR